MENVYVRLQRFNPFDYRKISQHLLQSIDESQSNGLLNIDSLTKSHYRHWYEHLYCQLSNYDRKRFFIFPSRHTRISAIIHFLILSLMMIRGIFMLSIDVNSIHVTIFGSFFHLVNVNRKQFELTILHYTLLSLIATIIMYFKRSTSRFLMVIILFCNRFIFVEQSEFKSRLWLKCNRIRLHTKMKYLLRFQATITIMMTINVALTAISIYMYVNPSQNHLEWFWSIDWYYFHSMIVIIGISLWTYSACFNMSYMFTFFVICCQLLQYKHQNEYRQMGHNVLNITPKYFLNTLQRHMDLLDELHHMNRYWRLHLSNSKLICGSIFCYTIYISVMTHAVWFIKLFFITVCCPPIFIVSINCWCSSKCNQLNNRLYRLYTNVLVQYVDHKYDSICLKVFWKNLFYLILFIFSLS